MSLIAHDSVSGRRDTLVMDAPERSFVSANVPASGDPVSRRLNLAVSGLSIAAVSRATRYHPETVRRYLRGQQPSVEFVGRFAQHFGISLEWLILGVGVMKPLARQEAGQLAPVAPVAGASRLTSSAS